MSKESPELQELITLRKLFILALLRSGMTQAEIGAALGVHRTQISRMFPKGALADASGKTAKVKGSPAAEGSN